MRDRARLSPLDDAGHVLQLDHMRSQRPIPIAAGFSGDVMRNIESDTMVARSQSSRVAAALAAGVLAVASVISGISCSGGGSASTTSSTSIGNSTSAHAIHVTAKRPNGTTAPLSFGPGIEARFASSTAAGGTQTVQPQTLRLKGAASPGGLHAEGLGMNGGGGDLYLGGAGVQVQGPSTVDQPEVNPWDTAWAIVWRAVLDCGYVNVSESDRDISNGLPWGTTGLGLGQSEATAWFFYGVAAPGVSPSGTFGQTCSDRLAIEQNLLCVADHLSAVSDAVGMTVWPALPQSSPDAGAFTYSAAPDAATPNFSDKYVEWDIPPQSDADRFILRDLAIYVIGLIPTVDAFTDVDFSNTTVPQNSSCAQAFASLAISANANQLECQPAVTGDASMGYGDNWSQPAFGVPYTAPTTDGGAPNMFPTLPPSAVPLCNANGSDVNVVTVASNALALEAQIMRGAGRLLHDLIRRDVYSDLASSASATAQALDPVAGNKLGWGVSLPASGQQPYGSVSHAARVLMGRWEVGDPSDPNSPFPSSLTTPLATPRLGILTGGTSASPSVLSASPPYGPELDARLGDLPIRTPGEATAAQLVEQTGIVVPSCMLPGGAGFPDGGLPDGSVASGAGAPGSATALRSALAAQLLIQAQTQNNPVGYTPDPNDPQAAVFQGQVAALSDAEVTFAFGRALRTWRIATNQPDPPCSYFQTSANFPAAGLTPSATASVSSAVQALGGTAIAGGLARSHLTTETVARAGGMLRASQFPDGVYATAEGGALQPLPFLGPGTVPSGWTPWGTPQGASLYLPPGASTQATLPTVVFQDAFHMGQALERRLAIIDQLAVTLPSGSGVDPTTGPDAVARGGIAELKSWAGSTLVHGWLTSPTSMNVLVQGMSASDLGVDPSSFTADAVQNAFGFVYGAPWVAECATGVRSDCPANFNATYVQPASAVTDLATVSGDNPFALSTLQSYGIQNSAYMLTLPLSGAAGFAPVAESQLGGGGNSSLYMVLLQDPHSTLGRGRVLGVLQPVVAPPSGFTSAVFNFVDAPMQKELQHSSLDLGKWVTTLPSLLGDISLSATPTYCVDGVPLDVFVPLDNELVSGSQTYEDSWQAYLSLAQSAASTADMLGQQLIADDLQISMNQQAAGAQLANLCGDFGIISGATVSKNGTVTPAADDATGSACVEPALVDVSYIGDIPAALTTCAGNVTGPALTSALSDCFKHNVIKCPPAGTSKDKRCSSTTTLNIQALKLVGSSSNGGGTSNTSTTTKCAALSTAISTLPKSLDGQGFYDALLKTFSSAAIAGIGTAAKMSVDIGNRWSVAVDGQTIMSSTDTSFWPACLANGCASLTGAAQLQAGYLNTAFRWCPSVADQDPTALLHEPLGCDGPDALSNQAAELNVLKWRVTQGLWMMAVNAGVAPANMFSIPVPIALEPIITSPSTPPVPFIAAEDGAWKIAPSQKTVPGLWPGSSVTLQGWVAQPTLSNAQVAQIGTAYDVAPGFSAFTSHAAMEIPSWYMNMYAQAASTGLMNTSPSWGNPSVAFNDCNYTTMTGTTDSACFASPPPTDVTPFALSMAQLAAGGSSQLNGMLCGQPFGEGDPAGAVTTPMRSFPLWQLVAAAKGELVGELSSTSSARGAANRFAYISCGVLGGIASGFTCPQFSTQSLGGSPQYWDQNIDQISMNSPLSVSNSHWSGLGGVSLPLAPDERVLGFLGLSSPAGSCAAMHLLSQPAAIACAAAIAPPATVVGGPPTEIRNVADLATLSGWITNTQQDLSTMLGSYYITNLPQTVVTAIVKKTVGHGSAQGTMGADMLEMEESVQSISSNWSQMTGGLASVQQAIGSALLAVQEAEENSKTTGLSLAFSAASVQGQILQTGFGALEQAAAALANSASSYGTSDAEIPILIAGAAMQISNDNKQLTILQSQAASSQQAASTQVQQALQALTSQTTTSWTQIATSMSAVVAAIATIEQDQTQVQLTQQQAEYQLAVGTGQDSVVINGQEVAIPVDTVLRRQASATQARYNIALLNAKALAYMARRAIEQRVGVPLSAFTQSVGPLDAPASWADDICKLQGVNYASLSGLDGGGGIGGVADLSAISHFADGWVGDYVTKLQNFVTYYNVQYPSHQGDDTAVLSLRYDILAPASECEAAAANLLLESGDMSSSLTNTTGWLQGACASGSGKCLAILSGDTLPPPATGPDGVGGVTGDGGVGSGASGVTLLADVPSTVTDGGMTDAGASGANPDGGAGAGPGIAPMNTVFQSVALPPGAYVLSWWDQARAPLSTSAAPGILLSGTPVPYFVEVLDPTGQQLASATPVPFQTSTTDASPDALWSLRNELSFVVNQQGTYVVAFAASTLAGASGSVAIADVQLESSPSGNPTPYVATSSTTEVASFNCPMSGSDLRSSFTHACDATGVCWYDLTTPLVIDTGSDTGGLNSGQSSVGAKLAAGNFNYRNIDVAINLVGTSVHTCVNDSDPSCYGSGYVQYDLTDNAMSAGIVGYDGNTRYFDFGIASINHGKALAAERYLTMPLATADRQLVTQPGIQHIELSGRPLDGTYGLRVWDSPDLNWSALQDIQIVFDYEYWSSIIANGNVEGHRPHPFHLSHPKPSIRRGNPRHGR
jgi:hypothetical protein